MLVLLWKSIYRRGAEFAEFFSLLLGALSASAMSSFLEGAAIARNSDRAETVGAHRADLGKSTQCRRCCSDCRRRTCTSYFVKKNIVKVITRNAKRLHRLTDDILDVTRIDSKILKFNKESVDIDEVIDEVIDDFRNKVDHSNDEHVKLVKVFKRRSNKSGYHTGSLNVTKLICDKNRVMQIISNLISNAIKFSPKNGTITISKEVSKKTKSIVISVIDRGSGIDPDIFPRLFSKFSTRSNHGTGLGLYICKNLVEAQGGRIWAQDNNDGPGATFSFSLPIVNAI